MPHQYFISTAAVSKNLFVSFGICIVLSICIVCICIVHLEGIRVRYVNFWCLRHRCLRQEHGQCQGGPSCPNAPHPPLDPKMTWNFGFLDTGWGGNPGSVTLCCAGACNRCLQWEAIEASYYIHYRFQHGQLPDPIRRFPPHPTPNPIHPLTAPQKFDHFFTTSSCFNWASS